MGGSVGAHGACLPTNRPTLWGSGSWSGLQELHLRAQPWGSARAQVPTSDLHSGTHGQPSGH